MKEVTVRYSRTVLLLLLPAVFLNVERALAQYTWQSVTVGDSVESRFFRDGFHFATLIADDQGRLIFRGHPDQGDSNGWGTSYYINPFLAGADPRWGAVNTIGQNAGGLSIALNGAIAFGANSTYGTWTWNAALSYDADLQIVVGSGSLSIVMPGTLTTAGADLNLERISSNFLSNVPLQTGGTGSTGDMRHAFVRYGVAADPHDFKWNPQEQPTHFPQDFSQYLSTDLIGDRNAVDTLALGQPFQIQIARKPSFQLAFGSISASDKMIFGGLWNQDQGQNFAADNIGVNHLVMRGSTNSTSMSFNFAFEYERPPLADYNRNGVVDAADYVVWRKSTGAAGSNLPADGDGSGVVGPPDYLFWRSHFGEAYSNNAQVNSNIPEPTSWLLFVSLVANIFVVEHRNGRRSRCRRGFRGLPHPTTSCNGREKVQ